MSTALAAEHAGWKASLRLVLRASGGRTVLAERRHEGPLVVQRPFYPEGPACHLYLVHPPGGVAGGDRLALHVNAEPGAQAVITTPAATKIYRSFGAREAGVSQQLRVNDATLEWLPQETIVFRGARVQLTTRIHLTGRARFIGWEILCLGRPACGERFSCGSVNQDFELWWHDRPLLIDHLRVQGDSSALDAHWGLADKPVLGTMLAFPADATQLQCARAQSAEEAACTLVDGVLLVRLRGDSAEAVRTQLQRIWNALRPAFSGMAPHAPRIWAT